MTWRSEESLMPMCYCCPLPMGLHFVNLICFFMCMLDTLMETTFQKANILGSSTLGIPRTGGLGFMWAFAGVTAFVGSATLYTEPSKQKGFFLKIWRGLLICFCVVAFVKMAVTISELNKWAWEREEQRREENKGTERSFFEQKLFEVVEFSLRWWIFDQLTFPENIAYFSVRHWGIVVYYGILLPLFALIISISYINQYLRVTNGGELDIITGLVRRRDLRKMRQQERAALLANQAPQSPRSNYSLLRFLLFIFIATGDLLTNLRSYCMRRLSS